MKNLLALFILLASSAFVAPFSAAQEKAAAPTLVGKWHFVLQTEGGDREVDSTFQLNGDQVTGKWGDSDVKGTFSDNKINLEFPIVSPEAGPGTIKIKGTLANDSLSGDWAFTEYSGSFKATRVKE